MIILLHTSKTMRSPAPGTPRRQPQLLGKAEELATFLQTLSPAQLAKHMHVSAELATKTHQTLAAWTSQPSRQSLAIDSFVGDIYSGLRASTMSAADRQYADEHLRILSGLYGILRPFDGISQYRLEMGYKLPVPYANLYDFWGESVADCLPKSGLIVNVASVEYSRTVTPFVDPARLVAPKFLTVDKATNQPVFRTVHAKIARGAFARWLITSRATEIGQFADFADIGYKYNAVLSEPGAPVFVCREFGGIGLSMRLET